MPRLCDRVSIIRNGRTVESGSLADLRHLTRTSVTAELAGPPDGLARLPGVHDVDVQGHRVRLQVDTEQLTAVLGSLSKTGVRSLTSTPPTLEELVVAPVLLLSGEETAGRAEPLLACAVGRLRWAAGHLTIAFGGSVLIMLLAGLGLAVGYGKEVGPLLGACLVQLPAVWVIGGLALLLYGVAPRLASAAWAVAVAVLLIGWVGPALNAPQLVLDLSPFGHLPKLPGGGMEWGPVVSLTGLAVVLAGGGLAGIRARDLTG